MSLFNPFTTTAANNAAGAINQGVAQGEGQALPWYLGGVQNLQQYGAQALSPLQQNFGAATQGVGAYGRALGLGNVPGATQRIAQQLQQTPGYQFQLQQGNNAILARNAATGGTGSGNEAKALADYNQNQAGTYYQNYINSLQPYLGMAQNTGGQIASTNMGIGQGVQQGYGNIGNMYYGGALTSAQAQAAAALAANQAGANQFGALSTGLSNLAGSGLFSGLGSGLMSLFGPSDAKLKEDIEPVGALYDGTNVYRYRFKGSPRTEIGLIAQEIEQTTPDAVIEFLPDLRAVDYHRATERAAKILEFSRERHDPPPTLRPYAAELLELAA